MTDTAETIERKPTPTMPSGWKLTGIVFSRAIIAVPFTVLHDPFGTVFLVVLCLAGLIMAGVRWMGGKSDKAVEHLVKAATYGVAIGVAASLAAHDQATIDDLVGKLDSYKQQTGQYPENLNELVPKLLPAIPKVGSMTFIYHREQENSYSLTYRPSIAGPCTYTPDRGGWKCQAR